MMDSSRGRKWNRECRVLYILRVMMISVLLPCIRFNRIRKRVSTLGKLSNGLLPSKFMRLYALSLGDSDTILEVGVVTRLPYQKSWHLQ